MAKYKGPKLSALSGDALKARLAHLSATHNTAAIPLKYLTTGQAQQRVLNARLNAKVVPGSEMTNRDLAREANAATSVQYGPLMASQALQPKQTTDYYNQYLATLKGIEASQAAQGQQLATTLGNIGQAGQTAATAENTRVNDQSAQDARSRGAVVDPSLAANAANAAQTTRNIATGGAQTAGLVAQNAAAYMAALQASGGAAKLGALNRNVSDALQTKREAGAFKNQYVGKRRSEEVTNTATAALAGQKQNTADADFSAQTGYTPAQWAQMTPAERLTALKKATNAKTKPAAPKVPKTPSTIAKPPSNYTGSEADWNNLSQSARDKWVKSHTKPGAKGKTPKGPKPPTGLGSLSPDKETTYASQANQVADILMHPPQFQPTGADGKPKGKPRPATRAEILSEIRAGKSPLGKGVDPRVVNIGLSLADNKGKGIGPWGEHNAHNLGVHVNKRWKRIKGKPKASPKGPAGPAGPLA